MLVLEAIAEEYSKAIATNKEENVDQMNKRISDGSAYPNILLTDWSDNR